MNFKVADIDKNLVKRCLQDDAMAQRELYDKYKKAMYTIAYRISNDQDLAADILQETFIKVFNNLNQYRKEASLGAWIKQILVRTAIYMVKQQKKFEEITEQNTNTWTNEEVITWPENLTGTTLHHAIQSLPTGYRTIFLLIEVEGFTHKKAAEMLGISEGTSKSQLFYAKKMLRKKLITQNN